MANRRMFSLDVVDTDRFLDMSASAQALYFHLPHVNRKYKEYHEQCLTPYPIMHIGIDSFQRTGYSEVERAVLGW